MKDRRVSMLFWGKFVAAVAVWVHGLVASILAYELTQSAFVVGLVNAVQFAPQLILTPLSGKLTDLGHGNSQLLIGRVLCAVGSGGLAVWMWLAPAGTGGAWPLLVSSLVVGLGFSAGGPALQAVIPNIIRPGELAVAMRLNNTPLVLARALGPALGAVMVAFAPPELSFGMAGLLHGAFLVALVIVKLPLAGRPDAGVDHSITAALRWVLADRPLFCLLLGVAAVGIGTEPGATLAPSLADRLGQSQDYVGWIATVMGSGAVLGVVLQRPLLKWVTVRRQGCTGLSVMAASCAVGGLSLQPAVTLVSFGILGAGFSIAMSGLGTLVQHRAPVGLRGRIMALWLVAFVGSRPLSAMIDGAVADHISLTAAMLGSAALVGFAAYWTRPSVVARPLPGR